jgi:hypothetical protein
MAVRGGAQAGMASQQRRFHWDKRKRAYVQLQPGERLKAGKRQRVESGALVGGKAQPTGVYERWARATQLRVAAPGDIEDPRAQPAGDLAARRAALPSPPRLQHPMWACDGRVQSERTQVDVCLRLLVRGVVGMGGHTAAKDATQRGGV